MSKHYYTLPIGTDAATIARQLRGYLVPAHDATLNAETVCPVPRIMIPDNRITAKGIVAIERHLGVKLRFSHTER